MRILFLGVATRESNDTIHKEHPTWKYISGHHSTGTSKDNHGEHEEVLTFQDSLRPLPLDNSGTLSALSYGSLFVLEMWLLSCQNIKLKIQGSKSILVYPQCKTKHYIKLLLFELCQ